MVHDLLEHEAGVTAGAWLLGGAACWSVYPSFRPRGAITWRRSLDRKSYKL